MPHRALLRSLAAGARTLASRLPPFGPVAAAGGVRLHALDGIRGWAALCVVCFHMSWETFGGIVPAYRNPWTGALLDGSLAVSVFFVLSGEALSVAYFSGRGLRSVVELAIRRYPRLFIPILAVSCLTFAVDRLGLCFNAAAGDLVGRPDWLGGWLSMPVTVGAVLRFSAVDAFASGLSRDTLVPFLWTMRLEFAGSVLVFASLMLCHRTRWGWHAVALCGLVALALPGNSAQLACFLAGMGLAGLRLSGVLSGVARDLRGRVLALVAVGALLAVDGVLHSREILAARTPAFAVILVLAISCSPWLTRAMEGRASQFLGRVSFPVFLVQFPVIVSFTSALIVAGARTGHLAAWSPLIVVASIAACIGAALLFTPVETFTKEFCRAFSGAVLRISGAEAARRRPAAADGAGRRALSGARPAR